MSFDIVPLVRTAMLQPFADAIDAAATPGKVLFYDGAKPVPGGAATALQATVNLTQPCATVDAALVTFTPGTEGMRFDDKEITWCRFTDGDGNVVADAGVKQLGDATPGAFVYVTNVNGLVGGFVRIESGTIGL